MVNGDIVFMRFPLTIDSSASADTAVTTVITGVINNLQYVNIHTELVFDKGTTTKATGVLIARDDL